MFIYTCIVFIISDGSQSSTSYKSLELDSRTCGPGGFALDTILEGKKVFKM